MTLKRPLISALMSVGLKLYMNTKQLRQKQYGFLWFGQDIAWVFFFYLIGVHVNLPDKQTLFNEKMNIQQCIKQGMKSITKNSKASWKFIKAVALKISLANYNFQKL